MAKLIVELDMGKISAEDYMKMVENNREAFFPTGNNHISIQKDRLLVDPMNTDCVLFNLLGVVDDSKEDDSSDTQVQSG